jgi:hypothetical protein
MRFKEKISRRPRDSVVARLKVAGSECAADAGVVIGYLKRHLVCKRKEVKLRKEINSPAIKTPILNIFPNYSLTKRRDGNFVQRILNNTWAAKQYSHRYNCTNKGQCMVAKRSPQN